MAVTVEARFPARVFSGTLNEYCTVRKWMFGTSGVKYSVVCTPPGFWHSIFGALLHQRRGTYEVHLLDPHMPSGDVSSWGNSWGLIEAAERQMGTAAATVEAAERQMGDSCGYRRGSWGNSWGNSWGQKTMRKRERQCSSSCSPSFGKNKESCVPL